MRKSPYHKYALLDNPFRFEAGGFEAGQREGLNLLNVKQEEDYELEDAFFDTLEKNRKTILQILGQEGAGKTERLLLLVERAKEEAASCCYLNAGGKGGFVLVAEILDALSKPKFRSKRKRFGIFTPGWLRELRGVRRWFLADGEDERKIGEGRVSAAIAGALNESSPSFLLLDDFEAGIDLRVVRLLQAVFEKVVRGVLIAIAAESGHGQSWIAKKVELRGFNEREAELCVAKRLLAERTVSEKLDPLYPFTPAAVRKVNESVRGNPKRLLEALAVILDAGVARRAEIIDEEFVLRTNFSQKFDQKGFAETILCNLCVFRSKASAFNRVQ